MKKTTRRSAAMGKAVTCVLFIFSLSAMCACASSDTAALLDAGVGKMTYSEAVEHFGQPFECTDLTAMKRCTWLNWRGLRYNPNMGFVQMPMGDDPPVALLTFKGGVLSEWHLSGKWK